MTANLYNKMYRSAKESLPQFKNAEDTIAFYISAAAKYARKAYQCSENHDYEGRSKETDNAIMILAGIRSAIDQFPNDDQKKMVHLNDYCLAMTNCLVGMNVKNNPEMIKGVISSLTKMASDWHRKADLRLKQDAKHDEQIFNSYQDQDVENQTQSSRSRVNMGPYPMAHMNSHTDIIG